MNTRKHPRTLNEAFGPYAGNVISEPTQPMDWQDRVVIGACIIVFIIFLVLVSVGSVK
jgi:hypothetical protein